MSAAIPANPPNPSVPSLIDSEVEGDLRSVVRTLLAERCDAQRVIARLDTPQEAYDEALWSVLAGELGVAGLLVAEEHGGAGASLREAAVVAEELGRALAPVPFLASAVLATVAVPDPGTLRALASGDVVAALVIPATHAPDSPFPHGISGRTDGDGVTLTGTVDHVIAADRADVLVVPALVDGVPQLVLVHASATGVVVARETALDPTRPLATVVLEGAHGRAVAGAESAEESVQRAVTACAAVLASEQLGTAEAAFDTAVDYLKVRHQFGRPIGSFQALRHRTADLWAELASARATARYAAACVAEGGEDADLAVALASATLGECAVRTAEESLQMHGGIGFTWEHPAHLYVKRAMAASLMFGTPDHHYDRLADLAALPA